MKILNKHKKFLLLLLVTLCVLFAHSVIFINKNINNNYVYKNSNVLNAKTETLKNADYYLNKVGYVINNFEVNIIVNDDNSYSINEKITALFDDLYCENEYGTLERREKHGIFRYIPNVINSEIEHNNKIVKVKNYAVVENVSCNVRTTRFEENGFRLIALGDPNELVNGKTVFYNLSYLYNIGYDRIKDFDMLFYNVLGNKTDTLIQNFSFNIRMPHNFDSSTLQINSTSLNFDAPEVEYSCENNVISGRSLRPLQEFEGISVFQKLPQGYFASVEDYKYYRDILIIIGSVIICLITIVVVYNSYHTHKTVKVVTFTPPDDMDPITMSYYYYGKVKPKSFASLIVYWANKKLLKITIKDKEVYLQKLKDISKDVPYFQQHMFNSIFNGTAEIVTVMDDGGVKIANKKLEEQVNKLVKDKTSKQIVKYNSISIKQAADNLNDDMVDCLRFSEEVNPQPRYNKKNEALTVLFVILSIIPTALYYFNYYFRVNFQVNIFIPVATFVVSCILFIALSYYARKARRKDGIIRTFFPHLILIGIIIVNVIVCNFTLTDKLADIYNLKLIVVPLTFIGLYFAPGLRSLSDEVKKYYGQIDGFKHSIEMVDGERLKMLNDENPTFFYDILPYAYIFGISKKFIKKFEKIAVIPLDNIYLDGFIDNIIFVNYIGNSLNYIDKSFKMVITQSIRTVADTVDNSHGSSRSSGGGNFPSGGYGGGGVGSW